MIAKSIQNRRRNVGRTGDFQRRLSYLERPNATLVTANIMGGWHGAAAEMQAIARLNSRVRDPAWHIVLSVRSDGLPSTDLMIRAARLVMRHIGASQHQYVIAIHPDPNGTPVGSRRIHAHILLNRVHPLTFGVLSRSQDWMRLELACRLVERDLGWPQDRGRMVPVEVNGALRLVPPPPEIRAARHRARAAGNRPMTPAQYGHEADCGLPSLPALWTRPMRAAILQVVRRARSWADLHTGLAEHGLLYTLCRGGARIWDAAGHIVAPASRVSGRMTLPVMLRRFGIWQKAGNEVHARAVDRAGSSLSPEIRSAVARLEAWQEAEQNRLAANHLAKRKKRYTWDMSILRARQQARENNSPLAHAMRHIFRISQSRFMPPPVQQPRLIAARGWAAKGRLARHRFGAEIGQHMATARQMAATRGWRQRRDHVSARELWAMASGGIGSLIHSATIRRLSDTECLLAARNADGMVTGYTRVIRGKGDLFAEPIPGGKPAIIAFGDPRAAERIAIYSNPVSAVEMLDVLAAETGGEIPADLAVLVVPDKIEESLKIHLKSIFSHQVILIQNSEIPNRNWEDHIKSCCSENQFLRVIPAPVKAPKNLQKLREFAHYTGSELPVPRPQDG